MSKQTELQMESTALATVPAQPPAVTNPMSILAAAVESGRPVSELSQLMEMSERCDRNVAAAAYNAAVSRFQSQCPVVHKSRTAKSGGNFAGYSYASYDDVIKVAKPHLDACGLSISFSFEPTDKGIKALCKVSHGSHHEDHWLTVPVPSDMKVNDTQKYGAAIKYVMRYALCGALNIVVSDDVDDDAESLCESISDADCRALEQLLMDTNSDIARFCKAYAIERVGDLPASQLTQARAQVNRKVAAARAGK